MSADVSPLRPGRSERRVMHAHLVEFTVPAGRNSASIALRHAAQWLETEGDAAALLSVDWSDSDDEDTLTLAVQAFGDELDHLVRRDFLDGPTPLPRTQ